MIFDDNDPKVQLVKTLLQNGIDAYCTSEEKASFEGFLQHVSEVAKMQSIHDAADDVKAEAIRAQQKHKPMNSHHEAYAVIKEEFDEYWAEVMKRPSKRDTAALRMELIQTAAMCLRTLAELC